MNSVCLVSPDYQSARGINTSSRPSWSTTTVMWTVGRPTFSTSAYNLLESPFSMFNLKELPPGVPQLITRSSSTLNTPITAPLPTTLTANLTTVNTRSLNHSTCPPTPQGTLT